MGGFSTNEKEFPCLSEGTNVIVCVWMSLLPSKKKKKASCSHGEWNFYRWLNVEFVTDGPMMGLRV